MVMHVAIIPNRSHARRIYCASPYREGPRVRKRTLANRSSLPDQQIFAIRAILRGEQLAPAAGLFRGDCLACARPPAGGSLRHAGAGLCAVDRDPPVRLSATWCARWWPRYSGASYQARHHALVVITTTLAQEFGVEHADENDLYGAMDWLLERQGVIEHEAGQATPERGRLGCFYDLSSSYLKERCCRWPSWGITATARRPKLQVNYGLVAPYLAWLSQLVCRCSSRRGIFHGR